MAALDDGVFAAFHHIRNQYPQWKTLFEAGWYFGEFGWLALLVLLWALAYPLPSALRRQTIWLTVAAVICIIVEEIVRRVLDFPRPSDAPNFLGPDGTGGSFPSRPIFLCSLMITVLWSFQRRLKTPRWLRYCWYLLGATLILWVLLAQLYFTLNYLTDILAGLFAGIGLGTLCHAFAKSKNPQAVSRERGTGE